ncbi:uncharacterized protein LOC105663780 [Megachile rotundata]|uniref:uncharacterized protein LOC105663780 n=1 Tax=Megachile rotundata TaxID=143995 RepID=UPI003FD0D2EF
MYRISQWKKKIPNESPAYRVQDKKAGTNLNKNKQDRVPTCIQRINEIEDKTGEIRVRRRRVGGREVM